MSGPEKIQDVLTTAVGALGKPRVRRSLAQLSLAFFTIVYLLVAMAVPPGFTGVFVGLGLIYLTAFLSIGSEWFWGRWFASGSKDGAVRLWNEDLEHATTLGAEATVSFLAFSPDSAYLAASIKENNWVAVWSLE